MVIRIKRKTFRNIVLSLALFFVVLTGFFLFKAFSQKEEGSMCAQVITPARNPETGEIKEFGTPCDVPEGWDTLEVGGGQEITRNGVTSKVYWNGDLGISFEYIISPDGYTLFEQARRGDDHRDMVAYFAVRNAKEYEEFIKSTQPREGPPEISIRVFNKTGTEDVFVWLGENTRITNYNKDVYPVSRATIGGVEAVEFLTDGLYLMKNYLLESNGKIYLISGPEDGTFNEIKRDFETLRKSIILF